MRLAGFSIQRYRSIIKAQDLPLGDLTVLIGPNNEGKSNILHGLVAGMRILQRAGSAGLIKGRFSSTAPRSDDYIWDRDFPVQLRDSHPDGSTIFDFAFELTDEELGAFRKEVGSSLTGLLPIRITANRGGITLRVFRKGAGSPKLTEKRDQIAQFLGSRIWLEYIPSIRTAESAEQVVGNIIDTELRQLEATDEYRNAVATIETLQTPILDSLSETIGSTLSTFLPDVSGVSLQIPSRDRLGALRRSVRITIDDGTATDIDLKGDGVKSLAAISLIKYSSERLARGRELILAIEEPEAHLHPEAIHTLRPVLEEIAKTQQVVVTTHSPLLVSRKNVPANILVEGSRARPAKTVEEIRESLGVRTQDNLKSARLVLICEGNSDSAILGAVLESRSSALAQALADGDLVIEACHGAGRLVSSLARLRSELCLVHVFVDADQASIDACKRAEDLRLLAPISRTLATCPGLKESEIEDLIDADLYSGWVQDTFGVALGAKFRSGKSKWSTRMQDAFKTAGQYWDQDVESRVKQAVASLVVDRPKEALHVKRAGAIDTLTGSLEDKLNAG